MNNLKIIVYNDEELHYMEGYILNMECAPQCVSYDNGYERKSYVGGMNYTFGANCEPDKETIQLDPTLMKRIAKYNKEKEIKKLDEKIKGKQEKLKELENKIEDREKRWKKIQDYVAKIYDLDINDYDEDYDEEEEW